MPFFLPQKTKPMEEQQVIKEGDFVYYITEAIDAEQDYTQFLVIARTKYLNSTSTCYHIKHLNDVFQCYREEISLEKPIRSFL
jgi:2-methylisocitrate lyase-like PEP mutase family enzyme